MNKYEVEVMRMHVKTICCTFDRVSVVDLPAFYCFALELGAAKGRLRGDDLTQFARVLVDKYVQRQLRREHLEQISFRVFTVIPAKELKPPDPTDPFGIKAACARAGYRG